jgi:hypothetical protein
VYVDLVDEVATAVGPRHVPEAIRSISAMPDADYADVFTITARAVRQASPERWARAVLEEAPLARRGARLLWHALGLRLAPSGSADHVQGWALADRGDNWIRIETSSWFMTCHAVAYVDEDRVSIALFIRYDRPPASVLWPPVSIGHRWAVPVLLRQALALLRDHRGERPHATD